MTNLFISFLVSSGVLAGDEAERVVNWASRRHDPIGVIAVEHGLLGASQVADVLNRQRELGVKFGRAGVQMGILSEPRLRSLLEIQKQRAWTRAMEVLTLSGLMTPDEAVGWYGRFILKHARHGVAEPIEAA